MIVECERCRLRYDLTGQAGNPRIRCRCGATIKPPEQGHRANALTCSSCGGATSSDKSRCEYCGNVLANLRCANCMSLQPPDMRHCGRCGSELSMAARAIDGDEARTLDCPRCDTPLTAQLVGDTLIEHCDACAGLWVELDALERLVETHDSQPSRRFAPRPGSIDNPTGRAPRRRSPVVYLKCPECETLMTRRNPAQRSGIIVDVCHAHGVWFDQEELATLLQLVRDGAERIPLVPSAEESRRAIAERAAENLLKSKRSSGTTLRHEQWTERRHWDILEESLPEVLSLINRLF